MIDWNRWGKIPSNDIEQYPTIIDIIQDIIQEEESHILNRYPLLHQENVLTQITRDGHYLLMANILMANPIERPPKRNILLKRNYSL